MKRKVVSAIAGALAVLMHGAISQAALDNKGKEFIQSFLPNFSSPAIQVHLTAEAPTMVTVEYPVNSPTFSTTVAVNPGAVTVVDLPPAASQGWPTDVVANNAVHLVAPDEFVAYLINRAPFTSDAALALPLDVLNTEYIVSTYNEAFVAAMFVVTAAFDNTVVTITPSNPVQGHPAGVPYTVLLDRGEGVMVRGTTTGTDGGLAGSIVTADKPVTVTNGNGCTQVPIGTAACDAIFEVAQPTQTWGKDALVVNLPQRPGGTVYRIVASEDGTAVTQDGVAIGTVDRGDYLEVGPLAGDHRFAADKPIFVTQYMTGVNSPGAISGDPAMGNQMPSAQYLTDYTFSTVGGSQFVQHFLTVIAENGDVGSLTLDGVPVAAGSFTPIAGTGYSSAVIALSEGTHTTSSANPHGITVEGYNSADSYLYPGGALFQFINPVGDANPPSCSVSCTGTTCSGSATDDRPSEDTNNNGTLESGEDLNGNGQIDTDTGIFLVELEAGSTNLSLTVAPFVPGDGSVTFTVEADPTPAAGAVIVTDGAGNTCRAPIDIGSMATCGNGVTETGEGCDDGAANGTAASCCSASCQPNAPGTSCDDGDACTQSDACDADGACIGSDPVVCPAPGPCRAPGTCNPGTGMCSDPPAPAGTPCHDGNACTQTDQCNGSGTCLGSNPVVCTALDQCHDAGVCNPSDGVCSNPPKNDGHVCDDGNVCTQLDRCVSGACIGGNAGGDTDGDGYCDLFEDQKGCNPEDEKEIPPQASTFGGAPNGGTGNVLVTYSGPSSKIIRRASDPSCAPAGVCGPHPPGFPYGFCVQGRIGDRCLADVDCDQAENACRLVVNYADVTDLELGYAVMNSRTQAIAGFMPVKPGCSRKVDLDFSASTRAVNVLRIRATGTVQSRRRTDRDVFIYR
jgi:hypothetical protein